MEARRGETIGSALAVAACLAAFGIGAVASPSAASPTGAREPAAAQQDDGSGVAGGHWSWIRGWGGHA